MKLLMGGSPCEYWSVAQSPDKRETIASGLGWELFENFRIALDKFHPDYFLYENNKSMSKAVKMQITEEFGFEPILINSALVSAQNRHRFYWLGKREEDGSYSRVNVEQPEDRCAILQDFLPNAVCLRMVRTEEGKRLRKKYEAKELHHGYNEHRKMSPRLDGKTNTLTTVAKDNMIAISCKENEVNAVYVLDGKAIISGKEKNVDLATGFYIIRTLSADECSVLQTIPDWYNFLKRESKNKSMIGKGWTVEVIRHLLRACDGLYTEPVDVLSMYDGMACGHIALTMEGIEISQYRATEIDKYAIQTACHNFPDIEQIGDAFQVREDGWE